MYRKLIIFGMNYIGDTLFSTPLIRALKKHYKDTVIDIVNGEKGLPILKNNKYINTVITRPKDKIAREVYIEKLRANHYDAAFLANTAFYAAYDAYKSKIGVRVGLASDFRQMFLTHKMPYQKHSMHIVDGMLSLLSPLGIEPDGIHYDIMLSEDENEFGKSVMKGYDKALLVHAGATRESKRYSTSSFANVLNAFYKETKLPIILIGGKDDISLSSAIENEAKNAVSLNVTGKYDLREMMAVIKHGRIFLGGDSAPLHIANAFSLFTLGIYGDTLPLVYGVRGEKSVNISGRAYCKNGFKSWYCEHVKRGCVTKECLIDLPYEAIVEELLIAAG